MSWQNELVDLLGAQFGDKLTVTVALGEVSVNVAVADYAAVCPVLHDAESLKFDILVDLAGVDYSGYGDGAYQGARFAVVLHLLSITHNLRLRLKVFAESDDFPVVSSVTKIWAAADWFEREAFDMFGLIFEGHNDLRRILTDYGFIGHPLRKDFPVTGHVEMRYDSEQKRVIYQPVTIDPREITPRVIREEGYGRKRYV
jgi:NADH-quinone oxidoreductase subunit C